MDNTRAFIHPSLLELDDCFDPNPSTFLDLPDVDSFDTNSFEIYMISQTISKTTKTF